MQFLKKRLSNFDLQDVEWSREAGLFPAVAQLYWVERPGHAGVSTTWWNRSAVSERHLLGHWLMKLGGADEVLLLQEDGQELSWLESWCTGSGVADQSPRVTGGKDTQIKTDK